MARPGLSYLIDYIRLNSVSGTADYTVGTTTYWSDDQIQAQMMRLHSRYIEMPLIMEPTLDTNGSTTYKHYKPRAGRAFEGTASGSPYWAITDSMGSVIPTSQYTVDSWSGRIVFTNDQAGSARFLTAYTYRPEATVADIWAVKTGHYSSAIDFRSSDQQFNRSQLFDNAEKMRRHWQSISGIEFSTVPMTYPPRG